MFDRSLTFVSFGRTIGGAGSHRTFSSTSGFWSPGSRARPKALSYRQADLGSVSVGVRRLEEARATGLACRDACSPLLARLSLRSPGGHGVRCSLSMLVGWLCNGRVAVFCRVPGYGRRRGWRITVWPIPDMPFPF